MSQQKTTPTVIGIDIGASTTKIAAVQRGAIQIITNQANFRQTPSIVGYGQGERKIGQAGNVKLRSNFKNTIVSPMRYLALSDPTSQLIYNPSMIINESELLFKVKDNSNKEIFLKPEQVFASYLTHLNKIIIQNNFDAKVITIAIPSYFTEIQKQAVMNAVEISQLSTHGKIVNIVEEHIAIGLDYGVYKKKEINEKKQQGKVVCFVDFGHSKFSTTVMKYSGDDMEVLMQKSIRNLGCRDIDQRLFDHYANIFNQKHGLNLKQNKKACLKLMEVIQKQRKILTGIKESQISIQCLMEDEDICEPISRDLIVELSSDIFTQMKQALSQTKKWATQKGIKIEEVQLVGGGTRILAVKDIIQQIFQKPTSRTINSSECIAKGATLSSVQKSGLFRLHTFKVKNKLNNQIKLSSLDQNMQNMELQNKYQMIVFQQNEQIPQKKTITLNKQGKISLNLKYNNTHKNKSVICDLMKINFEIKDQEGKPEDQSEPKIQIEGENQENIEDDRQLQKKQTKINFTIDSNGFVKVNKITYNDKPIQFEIQKYKTLSEKQINQYKSIQRSMFVKDYEIIKSYQKKNQLESCVYKHKQILNSGSITQYLSDDQKQKITKYFQQLEDSLYNQDLLFTIKDFQQKINEVQQMTKQVKNVVEDKKKQVQMYFEQIQKLKQKSIETLNHISSKYRNTRTVSQVYQQIKQIHDWAVQLIQKSKSSKITQLPLIAKQDIDKKYMEIKRLMSVLSNPSPQQQYNTQPQRGHPFGYYESPRYQAQPRRRMNTHQNYDPFGMSRSAYFPSNNFFGGFF